MEPRRARRLILAACALAAAAAGCAPEPPDAGAPSKPAETVPDRYAGSAARRKREMDAARPSDGIARIAPAELDAAMAAPERPLLLNVRSGDGEPRVRGAADVGEDRLEEWAGRVARDRAVVTYCSCPNDAAAVRAALRLKELGFSNVSVLDGGLEAWQIAGLPVDPPR